MASIVAYTTLQLDAKTKQDYFQELGDAATTAFQIGPQFRSIMWCAMDTENFTPSDKEILNLFVYTAPDKTTDMKREFVKKAQEVTDRYFGAGKVACVIIMKIHGDENVGVNGALRWDTKNQ